MAVVYDWRVNPLAVDRDFTGVESYQSQQVDTHGCSAFSIQTEYTGTVGGTLSVWGRNHEDLTFRVIAEIVLVNPAGAPGGQVYEVGNLGTRLLQFRYAHASGAGNLKIAVNGKGRN
jgi:hypothetical protein